MTVYKCVCPGNSLFSVATFLDFRPSFLNYRPVLVGSGEDRRVGAQAWKMVEGKG